MDITGRMLELLTVRTRASVNGYGERTSVTEQQVRARIERLSGTALQPDGSRLVYQARVFTMHPVALSDTLRFPEDDAETEKRPLRVQQRRGLDGRVSYYEVWT